MSTTMPMTRRSDEDTLEVLIPRGAPPPHKQANLSAAETGEPGGISIEKRIDIVRQIRDLEASLEYMGTGHPRLLEMRGRLSSLHSLLSRWDQTKELQARRPR